MKFLTYSLAILCACFCLQSLSQSNGIQIITIDSELDESTYAAGGSCFAQDLVLEGPETLCPEQFTIVDIDEPNTFPVGGGQGIRFTNYEDMDFVISGMDFPYSFDDDINGILSTNGVEPLNGFFSLTTVTFTDASSVPTSICSESSSPVDLFFLDSDESICDEDPCFAQSLNLVGPAQVCPTGSTTVDVENPNTIPQNGGEGVRVLDGDNFDVDAILPDIEFPYEINSDLNGYLSDNDLDPLEGSFFFGAVVYADFNDPENSICWTGSSVEINFLSPIEPDCIESDCFAQDLTTFGTPSICPNETASINLINVNTVPEDGGQGVRFSDGLDIDFIVPVAEFPFVFDGTINGFLEENNIAQLEGNFQLTSVVYNDPNDIENSLCSESAGSINVEFIPGQDAECLECSAEWMFGGPNSVCPGEFATLHVGGSFIPTGGGQGLKCIDEEGTEILIPDVSFPYDIDNDANGFLSANDLDPFVGQVIFLAIIYTDPNDFAGSICAEAEIAMSVTFLAPDDISCVPCEVQDLEIIGEEFLCPDETTDLDFVDDITIPEEGGVGLRVILNSLGTEIWLPNISFPYTVDNDLGGYLSSNGMDPAQGWLLFRPFIYVDPEDPVNSICMLGEQTDVNFLFPDNSTCQEECIVEDLILTGPDEVCPEDPTTVDLPPTSSIPSEGGIGIRFSDGDDVNIIYSGMDFPYTFDNDLNGELSDAGFDPFEGTLMLTSFIYDDPDNANSICSESENPVIISFLGENEPACLTSVTDFMSISGWDLVPNPSSDLVSIQFEAIKSGNLQLNLFDIQGRLIKSNTHAVANGRVNIILDVNDVAEGYYRVVLNMEGKQDSRPLIVSRL